MTQENKQIQLLPIERNYTDEEILPEGVKRFNAGELGEPGLKPTLLPVERGYTDEVENAGPEESEDEKPAETRKYAPKVKIRDFSKDTEGVEEEEFNVVKPQKK